MMGSIGKNQYKIFYVSITKSPFAFEHHDEAFAKDANEAVQMFITNKEGIGEDVFVLKVFERKLEYGEKRYRRVI